MSPYMDEVTRANALIDQCKAALHFEPWLAQQLAEQAQHILLDLTDAGHELNEKLFHEARFCYLLATARDGDLLNFYKMYDFVFGFKPTQIGDKEENIREPRRYVRNCAWVLGMVDHSRPKVAGYMISWLYRR